MFFFFCSKGSVIVEVEFEEDAPRNTEDIKAEITTKLSQMEQERLSAGVAPNSDPWQVERESVEVNEG